MMGDPMLRLTLATVMSLGLVGAAKAGEFDNDIAKPSKAKHAASAPAADLNGGSEFDKESPAQAHRYRGWGGRWGGGWGWGGGWNRGWGVNINIGRGWGGWGYPRYGWGGWNRGWGGWGGWGWGGYRSYYSSPIFTSYPFYSSFYSPTYYSSYYTPVYYSSVGFAPCYYW
jgi:hypothetical protein